MCCLFEQFIFSFSHSTAFYKFNNMPVAKILRVDWMGNGIARIFHQQLPGAWKMKQCIYVSTKRRMTRVAIAFRLIFRIKTYNKMPISKLHYVEQKPNENVVFGQRAINLHIGTCTRWQFNCYYQRNWMRNLYRSSQCRVWWKISKVNIRFRLLQNSL